MEDHEERGRVLWKERMGQSRGQGSPLPSLVPVVILDGTHVFLCFLRAGGKALGRRKEGKRGSTRLVFSPEFGFLPFGIQF